MTAAGWRGLRYLAMRRRGEWRTWTLLAVVVAVVVAVATGLFRQVERAGEDTLAVEIERTPPVERGLTLELFDRRSPLSDPTESFFRASRDAIDASPAPVAASFGEPELVIDLTRYQVNDLDGAPPPFPTFLTIRTIDGLDDRITVVEGAPGEATTDETEEEVRIIEIGLSVATAAELGVEIGTVLAVQPDPDDLLLRRTGVFPPDIALRVAEIVELADPAGPEWFGDERLHRPIIDDTRTGADVFAFAFIRPDVLPRTILSRAPFAATRLADLTPGAVTLETTDQLERALERFLSTSASADTSPGAVFPSTRLVDLLERERIERVTARDLLDLALHGLVALALVAVLLVAEAGSRRGARDATVARGRGASRLQLVALTGVEALLVVSTGAVVGSVLANALVDGAVGAGASLGPAVAVVALTTVVVVGLAVGRHRPPLGEVLSARGHQRRPPARLAVASEVGVYGVAIAGWVTLRRAGIGGDEPAGLLVTIAPLALAAAVVMVARRIPTRLARRLADRSNRPGLAVPLGLRQAEQGDATATALVGAIVLAAVPVTIGAALLGAVGTGESGGLDDPLAAALRRSAIVVVGSAVVLAALAVASIARLVVDERRRQRAMLTSMGAPADVAARALSTELAVPGLVAAATAGLLGAVLSLQLAGRVDLAVVTGRDGDTISTDWWVGAAAGIVLAAICIGAAAVTQLAGHTTDAARMLRTEEGT